MSWLYLNPSVFYISDTVKVVYNPKTDRGGGMVKEAILWQMHFCKITTNNSQLPPKTHVQP